MRYLVAFLSLLSLNVFAQGGRLQLAPPVVLPAATATTLGGVKIGAGLTITADGTLGWTNTYSLPSASATVLGGIKIGSGLSIAGDGTVSAIGGSAYTLPIASASVLGGFKVGTNLAIDGNGVLSATTPSGGSSVWGTNGSSAYYTAGSVGIGTNNPTSLLYIKTNGTGYQSYLTAEAPSGDKLFTYFNSNTNVWQWDTFNQNLTGDDARKGLSFQPDGGRVGIGIGSGNAPARLLDVGGVIRSKSGGFEFPDGSVQSTAATSGGGSSGFPAQLGTLVSGTTGAALQAAINAASAGATLVLANDIDVSGGTVEINKKITLITYNGSGLNGGTGNVMLLKIYNCDGVKLLNLKFTTSYAGGGFQYGMVTINEQGPVTNLTINNCEFTAPTAANGSTYNAITGNAWSSGNSVVHSNWTITNNYAHDLNRMFIELNNNGSDGAVRYTNLNISHNRILHTGLVDPYDGMGISLSGRMDQVKVNDNTIDDYKGYGIEFVQISGFEAVGNNLTTTKTFVRNNGTEGSNGYNLTDGGATDGGTPGRGSRKGNITGGYVNVPGKGIVAYYVSDINISGGYYYSGAYLNIQNSQRISLSGIQVESLFQSCLKLDGSSYCTVFGGRFSTENAVGGKYEQIGMFGSATGNSVVGAALYGTSDNGSNILGPTGNKWANVFFGGAYLSN